MRVMNRRGSVATAAAICMVTLSGFGRSSPDCKPRSMRRHCSPRER